ncbi:hypothetical protein SB822_55450, partial [Paraburkholderia sp. SIMBA_054]
YVIGFPCICLWAGFGTAMRRVLSDARCLRAFNITMALLLVLSLYPIALKLLDANGIGSGDDTTLVPSDGLQAATQLVAGEVDAAILSGDSATRGLMLRLLRVPGISVMNFDEASAYTR